MSRDNILALQAVDEDAGTQYLTFMLADGRYSLNALQVREIRGWGQVTRIPNAQVYLHGVINLRGAIVPVLDLRRRFDMPVAEYTMEAVVIVVHAEIQAGGKRPLGLVVDAVSDVLVAQDDEVSSTPDFGAYVPTENILGLVNADGHMVMLLDVGTLLETDSAAGGDA